VCPSSLLGDLLLLAHTAMVVHVHLRDRTRGMCAPVRFFHAPFHRPDAALALEVDIYYYATAAIS
jgi:hypothetical protein